MLQHQHEYCFIILSPRMHVLTEYQRQDRVVERKILFHGNLTATKAIASKAITKARK